MKITKIVLEKFRWFSLNTYDGIEIDFSAPLQLILGSNGSGKSSLMRQLNPLPGTQADFLPGGKKVVHITHRNLDYVLTSDITKGSKHSFLKDGTELNPDGTQVVQFELIERELGFTQELRSLITGTNRFTSMTPKQAMDMLMNISNLDLDFATGIWKKALERLNAAKYTTQYLQDKLKGQIRSLSMIENIDEQKETLERQRDRYSKILNSMNQLREVKGKYSEEIPVRSIKAVSDQLKHYRHCGLKDKDSLQRSIERVNGMISQYTGELQSLYRQKEEIDRDINKLCSLPEEQTLSYVQDRIKSLLAVDLTPIIGLNLNKDELAFSISQAKSLLSILNELTSGSDFQTMDRMYTTEQIANYEKGMAHIAGTLSQIEISRKENLMRLEHYESHKEAGITCSKCGTFNLPKGSLTEDAVENIHILLRNHDLVEEEYLKKKESGLKRMEHVRLFQQYQLKIQNALATHRDVAGLLEISVPSVFQYTGDCLSKLISYIRESEHQLELLGVSEELSRLQEQEKFLENNDVNRLAFAQNQVDLRITHLQDKLSGEKDAREHFLSMASTLTQVESTYQEYLKKIEEECYSIKRDVVNTLFDSLQKELLSTEQSVSTLTQNINSFDQLKASKEETERELAIAEEQFVVAKVLVDTLSPKYGLIASQMSLFLANFFARLNSILNDIFEMEIEISAAGEPGQSLEYKFQMAVNGVLTGTVNNASFGQKDLIDFAFTLTVMSALGLTDYPLYLDEMGVTFDDTHRLNWMNYIKALLDGGTCTQIFMISHYSAMHGGVSNYETAVLHKDNLLTVPSNANKHVRFM
mgnify:CR=1 FL=1